MISSWPSPDRLATQINVHTMLTVLEGLSAERVMMGITPYTTAAWPVANTAFFVPVMLNHLLITQFFVQNGSAVSGNIDVGLYTMDGTRIVSSGSTAHAGGSTNQLFNITDTLVGPGMFYLALALDNITGAINRGPMPTSVPPGVLGICEMASAFPLPAVATLATTANNYIPGFGLTARAVF